MSAVYNLGKIADATAITAGATVYSEVFDINDYKATGYFSLQLKVTGDGTVTITPLASNDVVTFVVPLTASGSRQTAVCTNFSKTGGPGTDGNDLISFSVPVARYIKFSLTNSSGSTANVTSILCIQ